MAQVRETFQPTSPRSSSGGEESYKHEGTPDTRLTAFSPSEERLVGSNRIVKPLGLSSSELQPIHFPVKPTSIYSGVPVQAGKDPFITSTSTNKSEQRLSPTASTFRPVLTPIVARGSTHGFPDQAALRGLDILRPHENLDFKLAANSETSRCLVLFSRAEGGTIGVLDAENFLLKLKQLGSACQGNRQLYDGGSKVYIYFKNIRDACMVHGNAQLGGQDWAAEYISPIEFHRLVNPGSRIDTITEGQVYVLAIPPPGVGFGPLQIEMFLCRAFGIEGELISFSRQKDSTENAFRAVAEFADVDAAGHAVSTYNGANINGIYIFLSLNNSEIPTHVNGAEAMAPSPTLSDINTIFQNMSMTKAPQPVGTLVPTGRTIAPTAGVPFHPQFPVYPMLCNGQLPPSTHYLVNPFVARGQSSTPLPTSFGPLYASLPPAPLPIARNDHPSPRAMQIYNGRMDSRRQNATRVHRSTYYNAAGHHNHVDVGRIRDGIDVRTTIMLRNIPNKVDQAMLKRIVDESSWGKYDFMYLRIDFANDCNVGYAFINFVDPLDIIDFVNARGNQRWNCFKSDKVAEISYATIQGKDCLVQKFRNSSVMLEPPHYRPKLYYTSNGSMPELTGQEEPFPEPDNQSKMKRSCENAEHVGLFTPNAGQHFRDEQRRRRSQYDRGTRLAALEECECDYETHMQQQSNLYLGH